MNGIEPERLYPAKPMLAASIAVFHDGRVLLARRTKSPGAGLLALPGGLVEAGETMAEAALRELREETGVSAGIIGFNTHTEIIERDGSGQIRHHFVVASYVGQWHSGIAQPGPEASQIVWATPGEAVALDLVTGLGDVLLKAWQILEIAR